MMGHRAGVAVLIVGLAGLVSAVPSVASTHDPASASPEVKILACNGKTVFEPRAFVISCADGNSELTATHWTTWTAKGATGTTRFGLNLCDPYCAASKISFFPGSTVRLSAPRSTKHGRLFSDLVVTYVLHGKHKTVNFSWTGDPSF